MVIISPLRLLYEDVVTSHWLMHDASNPATAHGSLNWKWGGFFWIRTSNSLEKDKTCHNTISCFIGPLIFASHSPPELTCVSVWATHLMWAAPLWLAGITKPGPPQHPSQHPPLLIGWARSRDRITASHWSTASPVQHHLISHWSRTSHRTLLSSFRTSFTTHSITMIILWSILIVGQVFFVRNDYESHYNSISTWCFVCFTISGSCLWWWTTATSSCPTSDLANQRTESLRIDQSVVSILSSHRPLASSEAAIWNRISEDNQINPVFARNTIWNLSHNSRGNFRDGEFSMFYDDWAQIISRED